MQCDLSKKSVLVDEALIPCFAQDTVEEILVALRAVQTSASETLQALLAQKSPISLKVTLAQLQQAQGKSFTECIKMEYRMTACFLRKPDFYEGVRALLIDKDKAPQWQPSHLAAVTSSVVRAYFEPLDSELVTEDLL